MSYFLNDPPYHPRKKCWAGYPPYGRSSPAHADTRRRGAAEENVQSVAAEQNLYSSTERWRESKAPPPVTSADLDLCVSKERVPMQIHSWTPATPPAPRALPNLSFSLFFFLFFLNCCCFGSMDSTYISHFFVSEFEFCFLSASISPLTGSPHVDTLLYESDVCLFFFSSCRYALLKCVKQPIHFIWKYKRIKTSDSFEKHKYELTVMHYFDCLQNKQNNTYNYSNN